MSLDSEKISCPYCGEFIEILVEDIGVQQRYYEDCQVCCRPILIEISPATDENSPDVRCLNADEVP